MLISAERGSAQIVSAGEETRFYDDVGCLASDWLAHSSGARAYVRVGNGWSDAAMLSFARPEGVRTAMGSGLVAFASVAEARAASGGEPMTFDEIARGAGARR